MRFDDFKNITAGFESLIVGLGVLVGGFWALYTFWTLKSIEKARAELERVRRELVSRGILEIELQPSQLTDGADKFIHVLIKIKNVGNGTEVIRWSESTVQAALIKSANQTDLVLGKPCLGSFLQVAVDIVFSTISPQVTEYDSFIIPVPEGGIYLVDVKLFGSPTEAAASMAEAKLAGVEAERVAWGSTTYFKVTDPPNI